MRKLSDLNEYLFLELERLNDASLSGEKLAAEIERARAVAIVASQVISNANIAVKAQMITQSANPPKFLEYDIDDTQKEI